MTDPAVLVATWFGVGLLPWAPGTWGSLAALPLAWYIHLYFGWIGLAAATAAVFVLGLWSAGATARRWGVEDPSEVVVDEVAGQWLTLLAVPPDPILYAVGFVLFRIADILKPWPASWADKRLKGGLGAMLDDVFAAAYAAGALYIMSRGMGGL